MYVWQNLADIAIQVWGPSCILLDFVGSWWRELVVWLQSSSVPASNLLCSSGRWHKACFSWTTPLLRPFANPRQILHSPLLSGDPPGALTDFFSPVLVSNPCFLGWIHALLDSIFCSRKPKSFSVPIVSDSVACGLFLACQVVVPY